MLPKVSRTFAACIKLLPNGLEHPVLIAYLLCRIADTIEDCARLQPGRKAALLQQFVASLTGGSIAEIAATFDAPENDDEQLTKDTDIVIREFHRLPPAQQQAISPWVIEMCEGMAWFSKQEASAEGLTALNTEADLDRYCYYVAGTVGHMLTDLFVLHHHRVTKRHYQNLKALATSFGLGLQLTNIIKDVADDQGRGWSFVPRGLCERLGVAPEDMLNPAHRDAAARVMRALINKAEGHLRDALNYCLILPRSQYRMRLFCLTPLYFAIRTLRAASKDPRLLDAGHKVKISRSEVGQIIRTTCLVAPNNHLVRSYFRRLAGC